MKWTIPILLGLASLGFSRGWTVSSTDPTARFRFISAAMDSASDDDTLYLDREPHSVTMAKRLVIIGKQPMPGMMASLTAQFDANGKGDGSTFWGLDLNIGVLSSAVEFHGIEIGYCPRVVLPTNQTFYDLYLHHSNIPNLNVVAAHGGRFENTVLGGTAIKGNPPPIFQHVDVPLSLVGDGFRASNLTEVTDAMGCRYQGTSGTGLVVENSLMPMVGCKDCHFRNTLIWDIDSSHVGAVFAKDSVVKWNTLVSPFWKTDLDQSGKPLYETGRGRHLAGVGKKAGSDGTDLGIYGGPMPWIDEGDPNALVPRMPLPYLKQFYLQSRRVGTLDSAKAFIEAVRVR